MKLEKQEIIYIPIDVTVEMPPKGEKISVSFDNGENFSYETVGKDWKKEEVSYTHWLKPIKDIFPLTEDELQSEFIKILTWYSKQGDEYRERKLLTECVQDYYKNNF